MAEPQWCPVFHPTKQEFARPFSEYVSAKFKENPSLPCFKVVPPAGWKPRQTPFPNFEDVTISTPIRQHAFGKAGAYRCLLVEQKPLTVAEYEKVAKEEEYRSMGHKGQAGSACATRNKDGPAGEPDPDTSNNANNSNGKGVDLSERSFWASITLNPPMYGADTPISFFDTELPYGWNLRNLGDLLRSTAVPDIPGVTSPMAYFGMWRSFFGWHKEDADLLSINYVHFGAPKVWYCVSPQHGDKFERMAAALFPDQGKECPAFIRHKDLLISPSQLRTFGIPFMQAKQQAGEFMVLNAAAYHAGFNMGFNCAEAINFATQDWIRVGKVANRCKCSVMRDVVVISMKLFDPNWKDPYATTDDDSDSEEASDSDDEVQIISKADLESGTFFNGKLTLPAKPHHAEPISRAHLLSIAMEAARRKREAAQREQEGPGVKRQALGVRKHIPVWRTAEELGAGGSSRAAQVVSRPAEDAPAAPKLVTYTYTSLSLPAQAVLCEAYARARKRHRRGKSGDGGSGGDKRASKVSKATSNGVKSSSDGEQTRPALKKAATAAGNGASGGDGGGSSAAAQSRAGAASSSNAGPSKKASGGGSDVKAELRKHTIAALQKHMSKKVDQANTPAPAVPVSKPKSGGGATTTSQQPATTASKPGNSSKPAATSSKPGSSSKPATTSSKPSGSSKPGSSSKQAAATSATPAAQPASGGTAAAKAGGTAAKASGGGAKVKDTLSESELIKDLERDPVQGPPVAIVWEDTKGRRYFHLVQQLKRAAPGKHDVLVRLLAEAPDGLFYPSATIWEEKKTSLVQVRSQQVAPGTSTSASAQLPAWKLLTLRSRILGTEFLD